MVLLVANKGNE